MLPINDKSIPQNTNRREFLRKSGAAALLSALPPQLFAGTPTLTPSHCNPGPNRDILAQLQRISDSPESRQISESVAAIFTSPELLSLPTYFLGKEAATLSSFQKDVLNTYTKLAANPTVLKNSLIGHPSPALHTIIASSPSYLTALAAGAEIKTLPALTPLLDQGIQEFITGLTTPIPTTPTAVPALDSVLSRLRTVAQTPAYTNVSHALLAIAQRSDFPAFVKGLDPADLLVFIPHATRIGLQLPIDTPDDILVSSILIAAAIVYIGKLSPGAAAAIGGAAWVGIAIVVLLAIGITAYLASKGNTAPLYDVTGVWHGTWLGWDANPPYTDTWTLIEQLNADGTVSVGGTSVRQEAQQYTFGLGGTLKDNQLNLTIPFGSGWIAQATVGLKTMTGTWTLDPKSPDYSPEVAAMPQNHGPLNFTKQ
jgi:hypothetical protein